MTRLGAGRGCGRTATKPSTQGLHRSARRSVHEQNAAEATTGCNIPPPHQAADLVLQHFTAGSSMITVLEPNRDNFKLKEMGKGGARYVGRGSENYQHTIHHISR